MSAFPDFRSAPNQGARPDLYELENRAIDPDGLVLALAAARDRRARVLPGSAEHLPLDDASVDVVHARFAYFWPPGCAAGLADAWWAARGASRTEVMSRWQFSSRGDFEAVLRLEFPAGVAGAWLADHPDASGLSYGYVLFAVRR